MARRATSLGPNPSLFLFCFFFGFCFLFSFFVFFGGFKGQVRWPKGPPHLALNPPYLFFFVVVFFCSFPFFAFNRKPCFPPKKGIFCLFSVFLFFPPLTFLASPFFCFSFSVSLLLLSFLIPSCLSFLLSFSFLFLSLFHFSFFFSFVSFSFVYEKNNMKIVNCNFFFSSIFFSLFLASCLIFSLKYLFLIFFPDLSYVLFVQHHCFWVSKNQVDKHQFWVNRGVAT